jgi:hypothetical protein
MLSAKTFTSNEKLNLDTTEKIMINNIFKVVEGK